MGLGLHGVGLGWDQEYVHGMGLGLDQEYLVRVWDGTRSTWYGSGMGPEVHGMGMGWNLFNLYNPTNSSKVCFCSPAQDYTNADNPFGDHHLLEKFVWHKVNRMKKI